MSETTVDRLEVHEARPGVRPRRRLYKLSDGQWSEEIGGVTYLVFEPERSLLLALAAATQRAERAEAEVKRLRDVIAWALGERDEFPLWEDAGDQTRRPGDGKSPRIGYFWWRTEMRRRYDSALAGDGGDDA